MGAPRQGRAWCWQVKPKEARTFQLVKNFSEPLRLLLLRECVIKQARRAINAPMGGITSMIEIPLSTDDLAENATRTKRKRIRDRRPSKLWQTRLCSQHEQPPVSESHSSKLQPAARSTIRKCTARSCRNPDGGMSPRARRIRAVSDVLASETLSPTPGFLTAQPEAHRRDFAVRRSDH